MSGFHIHHTDFMDQRQSLFDNLISALTVACFDWGIETMLLDRKLLNAEDT